MQQIIGIVLMVVGLAPLFAGGETETAVLDEAEQFREAFLEGRLSWDAVLERARSEGTVNWFHWGGSDELNTWIDTAVAPELAALGIELQTSRIPNTRDAVDLVIADNAAGRGLGEGAVDAIWINGENFRTLASQKLLFGPIADKLPNSRYFYLDPDLNAAAVNLSDFGYPNDLQEVPWSGAQYVCYVDTERLPRRDAPMTFQEMESWLRANPGRFTYTRPPHYVGNTFVQEALYAFNPDGTGYLPFQKGAEAFSPAEFARLVEPGFEWLRRIAPLLLGGSGVEGDVGGTIYPETPAANDAHFTNGEVDMACEFSIYHADIRIANGTYNESVENIIFPTSGMIQNKNFITIPANAPNPAAALVLVNLLSDPQNQLSKLIGIGYALGIDAPLLDSADQDAIIEQAPSLLGITYEQLAEAGVPDTNASLVDLIETIWIDYIERASNEPFAAIVERAFAQ